MNPSPAGHTPQQAAAVANALTGERAFREVAYPITGDASLDAISGCLAVTASKDLTSAQMVAIFRYLLERFENVHEQNMAFARQFSTGATAGAAQGTLPPPNPSVSPYPWSTTGAGHVVYDGETLPTGIGAQMSADLAALKETALRNSMMAGAQPLDPFDDRKPVGEKLLNPGPPVIKKRERCCD